MGRYDHWCRQPRRETVREMLARCAQADAERIREWSQDEFLNANAQAPGVGSRSGLTLRLTLSESAQCAAGMHQLVFEAARETGNGE
jgi:hypothetical protein